MKRLGSVLMVFGFTVGVILALGLAINIKVGDVPLLTAIGLGKLSFLLAAAIMGTGAFLRRLGLRDERRKVVSPPEDVR